MDLPSLEDLGNLNGKNVLVRADFNVPINSGEIIDDFRIKAAIPTLKYLLEAGANVTACSHLGRPNGVPDEKYTMAPVRERLQELLPAVTLIENLRFNEGETANEQGFVNELVSGQDAYVNDAFGASHRSHASIVGPPKVLPSAAGRLLFKEVEVLSALRNSPRRPFVAILGGSKVSDKIGVIDALLELVDELIIGGGMCFTFLKAKGHEVGSSLLEGDYVDYCGGLLESGAPIRLPHDITAMDSEGKIGNPTSGGVVRQVGVEIQNGWMGLDIGPGTAAEFGDRIAEARTILWNGPMGVFEDERFAAGTKHVAICMAENNAAFTVVGGGDSAAAAKKFNLENQMSHVSTGGGASLELIEKGDLPGLNALRESL